MQHPSGPDVSVIIVNWNSRELLRQCLRTVFQHAGDVRFEVIVIDNASFDGSEPMVRSEFPQAVFIQGDENAGFARANNAAAARASGRSLLFLNPDTEVSDGAIETMARFMDATPEAGAVGCRLLNTDGSLQTSCVQAFPTILNQILDAEALRRLFPESRLWGTRALLQDPATPSEVEAISGACLLVRRDVFLEVGRFTEAYFMYAEDIDLCFKLKGAGKQNYYLGSVSVVHHGGQSSNASSESQFGNLMMRESIAQFLNLRRGAGYARLYRLALATSALVRLTALGLAQILSLGRYRTSAVQSGLRKWSRILRWTVGAEGWVRNPGAGSS
jgi:GT2 family glycosyltransferase